MILSILPQAKYMLWLFGIDRTQMVEMVTWLAQYRETQHVVIRSYDLAYTLHNIDKHSH